MKTRGIVPVGPAGWRGARRGSRACCSRRVRVLKRAAGCRSRRAISATRRARRTARLPRVLRHRGPRARDLRQGASVGAARRRRSAPLRQRRGRHGAQLRERRGQHGPFVRERCRRYRVSRRPAGGERHQLARRSDVARRWCRSGFRESARRRARIGRPHVSGTRPSGRERHSHGGWRHTGSRGVASAGAAASRAAFRAGRAARDPSCARCRRSWRRLPRPPRLRAATAVVAAESASSEPRPGRERVRRSPPDAPVTILAPVLRPRRGLDSFAIRVARRVWRLVTRLPGLTGRSLYHGFIGFYNSDDLTLRVVHRVLRAAVAVSDAAAAVVAARQSHRQRAGPRRHRRVHLPATSRASSISSAGSSMRSAATVISASAARWCWSGRRSASSAR